MSRAASILRTIRTFGRTITVTRVETGLYDPQTGLVPVTETPATVRAGVKPMERLDGDRRARALEITVAAGDLPFTPRAGDRVTYAGNTFRIYDTNPVFVGEEPAAWIMEAAR